MKSKVLNLLLIISSLIGYLEWGKDQHSFLFEVEGDILKKLISNPSQIAHPFIILPLLGQLLLLITLFQKTTSKKLSYLGIASIGILYILMFAIGCLGLNFKILISTLPFLFLSVLSILHLRKRA